MDWRPPICSFCVGLHWRLKLSWGCCSPPKKGGTLGSPQPRSSHLRGGKLNGLAPLRRAPLLVMGQCPSTFGLGLSTKPPWPSDPCLFRKESEDQPQNKRIFFSAEPLIKTLEEKGKTHKKSKENGKNGESKDNEKSKDWRVSVVFQLSKQQNRTRTTSSAILGTLPNLGPEKKTMNTKTHKHSFHGPGILLRFPANFVYDLMCFPFSPRKKQHINKFDPHPCPGQSPKKVVDVYWFFPLKTVVGLSTGNPPKIETFTAWNRTRNHTRTPPDVRCNILVWSRRQKPISTFPWGRSSWLSTLFSPW